MRALLKGTWGSWKVCGVLGLKVSEIEGFRRVLPLGTIGKIWTSGLPVPSAFLSNLMVLNRRYLG